ncbi:MAG: short-chain dehydrogenase/reductase, partial [Myxococcales bacterium]|nr:short-chain dehydrogenase/reductase [Myxococcales bacterium]
MPSVLITGTSTGIGLASALEFARRDFETIAT